MKVKCTVRFEPGRGGKIDAVLYARGYALNYVPIYAPLTVAKARQAKAMLMRGCAELSRTMRTP
jgi:hypothetical protein